VFLRLIDRDHLRVRYDMTAAAAPSCAVPLPDPDATWAEYVR
jgi:hypothetical protein